jgi:hypothetical protein
MCLYPFVSLLLSAGIGDLDARLYPGMVRSIWVVLLKKNNAKYHTFIPFTKIYIHVGALGDPFPGPGWSPCK